MSKKKTGCGTQGWLQWWMTARGLSHPFAHQFTYGSLAWASQLIDELSLQLPHSVHEPVILIRNFLTLHSIQRIHTSNMSLIALGFGDAACNEGSSSGMTGRPTNAGCAAMVEIEKYLSLFTSLLNVFVRKIDRIYSNEISCW